MYRVLGAFLLGAVIACVAVFYGRDIWEFIRYEVGHGSIKGQPVGSDLVIALAQPFVLTASGNEINEDDIWDDTPAAVCEGAIAVENRSHQPLSVALDIRRRNGGVLTLMDGPDSMDIPPGQTSVRVVRDAHFFAEMSDADCNALNVPGALIVAIQACYGEDQGGDCSEAEIDPAGDAPRSRAPEYGEHGGGRGDHGDHYHPSH